jgi:hypothetical protein
MWLPTAYAALKGLAAYGSFEDAHNSALRIVEHMYKTYRDYDSHTIWECYHPERCEPARTTDGKKIVRKDFCGWSALGPISAFIEYVLGFHTVDAFEKRVKWFKPESTEKAIGIKNLRFGDIVTDIVAENGVCKVVSSKPYTLEIDGNDYEISEGNTEFIL